MRRVRVFIWGSCVSRDTFEHVAPGGHELVRYVARQSAVSATTAPVTLIAPPELTSRFQRRMVAGDFNSSLERELTALAGSTDLLLVDLVDERLGFYVLPDGSVLTRSVELIQAGDDELLPDGSRYLAFGTDEHFELWAPAIRSAGELIGRVMPDAEVVLLDLPWAELSATGEPTPASFGVTAQEANDRFRRYVDLAEQALGARTIRMESTEVTSGPTHPWGETPFHYAEDVYLRVVEGVTGRAGRAVWAAGGTSHALLATDGAGEIPLQELTSQYWRLTRGDGSVIAEAVRFNEDGSLWGRHERRETRWAVDAATLTLKSRDGSVTTIFPDLFLADEAPRFVGQTELDDVADGQVHLEPAPLGWQLRPRPRRSTRSLLAEQIQQHGWSVGDHTLGKPEIIGAGHAPLSIGKYCWFGNSVRLLLMQRRLDTVSLYPFHKLRAFWPSGSQHTPENSAGAIEIGHDVRVGANAEIHPGVQIGTGAAIARGSIVTEDVPPYAIVEGAPAQVVGYRFTDDQVSALLDLAWWDWPDEDVDAALPVMAQGVEAFLIDPHPRSRPAPED